VSFWIYILRCADGSYYTGHTDNLDARIAAHHAGELAGYTKNRRPLELVFTEMFPSREEALSAEQQVKGWSRAKKEALTRRDLIVVRPSTGSGRTELSAGCERAVAERRERNLREQKLPDSL
jgi:predicted GIY-YIG superfamily endonuclease